MDSDLSLFLEIGWQSLHTLARKTHGADHSYHPRWDRVTEHYMPPHEIAGDEAGDDRRTELDEAEEEEKLVGELAASRCRWLSHSVAMKSKMVVNRWMMPC